MEVKELIALCKRVKAAAKVGQDTLFDTTHDILAMPVENLSKFLVEVQIFGSVSIAYNEAYVYVSSLNLSHDEQIQLKDALK